MELIKYLTVIQQTFHLKYHIIFFIEVSNILQKITNGIKAAINNYDMMDGQVEYTHYLR